MNWISNKEKQTTACTDHINSYAMFSTQITKLLRLVTQLRMTNAPRLWFREWAQCNTLLQHVQAKQVGIEGSNAPMKYIHANYEDQL